MGGGGEHKDLRVIHVKVLACIVEAEYSIYTDLTKKYSKNGLTFRYKAWDVFRSFRFLVV